MQEDSARSASAERAIVSRVNNLSYSKNDTAEFYSYTKTRFAVISDTSYKENRFSFPNNFDRINR